MKPNPKYAPEQFTTEAEQSAYKAGFNQGHGIACHNVPEIGKTYWTDEGKLKVDADNAADVHAILCFEAESNSRQYSPWEFLAKELNDSEDADVLWEAYEQGVSDGIYGDLESYTYEDEDEILHGCFCGTRGLEISMAREQAESASHQGSCDADVAILVKNPAIAAQLDAFAPDEIRAALKEYGAWDAEELADDEQNRHRAVWSAANDIKENLPR